jgi:NADH-quinone oxidoreductase subunit C
MEALYKRLSSEFEVRDLEKQRDDLHFFKVKKVQAVSLIQAMKDRFGYKHLVFFTVVDKIEEGKFHLLYMLHNYAEHHDLGIIVEISREGEDMESIHELWPAAMTYQQEIREMYGVEFPGSPRLHENFVLEGWDGPPPMRRDFDTKEYSENTFFPRKGRVTHDTREHMKKKLYPSEAETW